MKMRLLQISIWTVFLAFDKEAKRYWLLVVKRGLVTLQVSGDDPDQVRQVAAAALLRYAGQ